MLDLQKLVRDLPAAEELDREVTAAEEDAIRRASHVHDYVRGLRGILVDAGLLPPDESGREQATEDVVTEGAPVGMTEGVRVLMRAQPDRVWRASELEDELRARAWIPPTTRHPRRSIESVLSRLFAMGEVSRVQPGRYRWGGGDSSAGDLVGGDEPTNWLRRLPRSSP